LVVLKYFGFSVSIVLNLFLNNRRKYHVLACRFNFQLHDKNREVYLVDFKASNQQMTFQCFKIVKNFATVDWVDCLC